MTTSTEYLNRFKKEILDACGVKASYNRADLDKALEASGNRSGYNELYRLYKGPVFSFEDIAPEGYQEELSVKEESILSSSWSAPC